jgi:hypothetical protein
MTNRRKALWAVAAVITLLVVVAISIPNLLRSRTAAKRVSFVTRLGAEQQEAGGGGGGGDKIALYAQLAAPAAPDKWSCRPALPNQQSRRDA